MAASICSWFGKVKTDSLLSLKTTRISRSPKLINRTISRFTFSNESPILSSVKPAVISACTANQGTAEQIYSLSRSCCSMVQPIANKQADANEASDCRTYDGLNLLVPNPKKVKANAPEKHPKRQPKERLEPDTHCGENPSSKWAPLSVGFSLKTPLFYLRDCIRG